MKMTNTEFFRAHYFLRGKKSTTLRAARLVLVEGHTITDAADKMGITVPCLGRLVTDIKNVGNRVNKKHT